MDDIGGDDFGVTKVRVFVGAFSEFGGLVYRIPAPIFGGFWDFGSIPLQRGVGVRWRPGRWILQSCRLLRCTNSWMHYVGACCICCVCGLIC